MSASTYNWLTYLLLRGAVVLVLLAAVFFVAAVIGWRGPHRRRRLMAAAALAILGPLLIVAQQVLLYRVFVPSLGREVQQAQEALRDEASLVHVGDRVPSFKVKTLDGTEVAIDELRGKVVLVNFFATWCGSCVLDLPHLQQLWGEYRNRDDFSLLVIGREETGETLAAFRKEHGYLLPMAADPDRAVYALFAKEYIPRTYLVSRDGRVSFAETGLVEEDLAALKQKLAQELPATAP